MHFAQVGNGEGGFTDRDGCLLPARSPGVLDKGGRGSPRPSTLKGLVRGELSISAPPLHPLQIHHAQERRACLVAEPPMPSGRSV